MLSRAASTLSVLADESRLRLCALLREQELSVGDLVKVTGISQPRVSTHLGKLRDAAIVRDRKDGQHAFYALSATEGAEADVLRVLLEQAAGSSDPQLARDRRRLAALLEARRGSFPDAFAGEMERHYSPGRTWHSLAMGLAALLDLGDVLDVGSGDGAAAALLAPRCRSLACVDVNQRMVEAAQTRFAEMPNVAVHAADASALPFDARSFDTALLFHTLTYVGAPEAVVADVFRVLRPGGRLVALCLDEHDQEEQTSKFGERHAGFSTRKLKSLLTRAGFASVSVDLACVETKRPFFRVLLASSLKPTGSQSRASSKGTP